MVHACVAAGVQELREKLADAQQQVQSAVQDPSKCLAFLRPGRIIRVKEGQVCLFECVAAGGAVLCCCLHASVIVAAFLCTQPITPPCRTRGLDAHAVRLEPAVTQQACDEGAASVVAICRRTGAGASWSVC